MYFRNYYKDKKVYPNMGRGYDSTVWQKIYTNNAEKYVMVAELNSVVPTFNIVVDEPSMNPVHPHFDVDSTDVHYKLHLQPSWGFRVARADETLKSDEKAEYTGWKWDPITKQKIKIEDSSYDGAIYYNKKGFNPENHYILNEE
jgi:hypothetical protein